MLFRSVVVIAVGTGIGAWISTTMSVEPSPVEPAPVTVCNGHELLCDRPLNEVTFPGTHNSMAAASEREIGRASCRARVWRDGTISGAAGTCKKNEHHKRSASTGN